MARHSAVSSQCDLVVPGPHTCRAPWVHIFYLLKHLIMSYLTTIQAL